MRWTVALAIALAGCASAGGDTPEVPLCGPLDTLPPLPERCAPGELDEFETALSDQVLPHASSALVRAVLDDAARVRALCVDWGPGYGPGGARRALAEQLDAIRALPPGPACAAGKRVDLNRYQAKLAEIEARRSRCEEQTRVTRETQEPTTVRDRTVRGHYGVYDREFERCMEYQADWIELDAPGTTRPAIFVKPELREPPGADAYDTASRCARKSHRFEKRAA